MLSHVSKIVAAALAGAGLMLVSPAQADVKIVCAGQSPRGMEFGAAYGNYNFTISRGTKPESRTVIGDRNYGEGSSREHAALSPRLLGGGRVAARLERTRRVRLDRARRRRLRGYPRRRWLSAARD